MSNVIKNERALNLWKRFFAEIDYPYEDQVISGWYEKSCFFCGEIKTTGAQGVDTTSHKKDCIYTEAKKLVEEELK